MEHRIMQEISNWDCLATPRD